MGRLLRAVSLLGCGALCAGAAAAASDPVVLAAGDVASCDSTGDSETADLLDGLSGSILAPGDLAYDDGTAQEFADCYGPTWGRHKARTYPAPGNHEYNSTNALGYYNYFGAVAGDPDEGWYSFDLGAWHIVSLNSNCSDIGGCERDSKQGEWLAQDLASHPAACTLAFWHHPRFNSGDHHGSQKQMSDFWAILDEHDADVILSGHEHLYERFGLQDADGSADADGIRQFTVGMGGRSHYAFGTPLPQSEARNATAYGVLQLTLHATSYDWEFVPVAGASYSDSGTASCVGAAPPPPPPPGPSACGPKNGGDVDADEVCGLADNCPSDANAGQADGDDDGWGDACDAGAGGGLDALVAAASDDASEGVSSGKVKLGGKSLKLGKNLAGLRFPSSGIPGGAQISNAFVEFEIEKPISKAFALTVRGQETSAASSFAEAAFDVSARAETSTSASWSASPPADPQKGLQVLRSPDLSNLLEEIASTPGWSTSSAVVLVLEGQSAVSLPAFESEPATNARLHVQLAP